MVAVGWTGTWFADLEKRDPSRLTLAAGMLNTDLYLYRASGSARPRSP